MPSVPKLTITQAINMGKKKSKQKKTSPPSPKPTQKTGIGSPIITAIWVILAIGVSYLAQDPNVYTKIEEVLGSNIFPSALTQRKTLLRNYTWIRNPSYDNNGFIIGREQSNLTLMSPSLRSEFEVSNPEDLSPYIKYLPGPPISERRERAMGVRFRSFIKQPLEIYWDDGTAKGVYSGVIRYKQDNPTNSYTTHKFKFVDSFSKKLIQTVEIVEGKHFYFIGPLEDDKHEFETKFYAESLKEKKFLEDYYTEHGYPWLSYYPRGKPELFIYPADFVGQVHKVKSQISYFHDGNGVATQDGKEIDFNIVVASTSPKVFLIENLLSDYEVDHIISLGESKVKRSSVGSSGNGFQSKTRTSENGWLQRSESDVLNTLYLRFGDVLRMTDEQLKDDTTGSAENLQFVRYLQTQKYDAHHDFGNTGRVEQRFSTTLIYLEVPEGGGGTSFPKAFDGQGIQVKPKKGDAVLFYSMLEDGNGDDFSLHSGMPVTSGRKYVCNLWCWDPRRYF
eukprot:maker-scaffold_32-snap-gene-2.62-mRNA-1 protein AED:0.05 eAED:0.05 QI:56/1/1/1/1/1/4/24/505